MVVQPAEQEILLLALCANIAGGKVADHGAERGAHSEGNYHVIPLHQPAEAGKKQAGYSHDRRVTSFHSGPPSSVLLCSRYII